MTVDTRRETRQTPGIVSARKALVLGAIVGVGTAHATTGAAQLVEVRETVQEVIVPVYVEAPSAPRRLFADVDDDALLGYGVPPEWLDAVRSDGRISEGGLQQAAAASLQHPASSRHAFSISSAELRRGVAGVLEAARWEPRVDDTEFAGLAITLHRQRPGNEHQACGVRKSVPPANLELSGGEPSLRTPQGRLTFSSLASPGPVTVCATARHADHRQRSAESGRRGEVQPTSGYRRFLVTVCC
jgi:hypothetical protein